MRSRLVAMLSVLSLVLCAATCALWFRSLWGFDEFYGGRSPLYFALVSNDGKLHFDIIDKIPDSRAFRHEHIVFDDDGPLSTFEDKYPAATGLHPLVISDDNLHLGFGCAYGKEDLLTVGEHESGIESSYAIVAMPDWAAVILLGILPICFALRVRRRIRRFRNGLCANCGYDLRATRNRCPECGTEPPSRLARLRI